MARRWASNENPSTCSSELTLTYVAVFMLSSLVPAVIAYFILFPPLGTEVILEDLADHSHESP